MTTIDRQLEVFNTQIEKIKANPNQWYSYHHSENNDIIWIKIGSILSNNFHEKAHTTIAIHSNGMINKVVHRL